MMKCNKRILSGILTIVMTIGCLAGCSPQSSQVHKNDMVKKNVKPVIAESDIEFIRDGSSEYKIVYTENATEGEKFVVKDLQFFIKMATGAELEIVLENEDMPEGKYIYVGATKASERAGVNPTYEEVKNGGFVIRLIDDDLYLRGYQVFGTRSSVYEFLYHAFDYEIYAIDEIHVTETKNANMLDFDLTVTPDFDLQKPSFGEPILHEELQYRMRQVSSPEILVTERLNHNSMTIIDPSEYDWQSEEYRDWFSDEVWNGFDGGASRPCQLCYSNEEMTKEFSKNLIELLKDSSKPMMLIGMEDNKKWCTCEKCAAEKEKYGTNAAVMIKFINKLQKDVDDWFAENKPDSKPTMLLCFAYYETVKPPVTYDEKAEKWVPIDEDVILNKNSGIYFAPIENQYDVAFAESEKTSLDTTNGQLCGWNALTDHISAWTYSFLPNTGFLFCNTFETMQRDFQFMKENGVTVSGVQADNYQMGPTTGFTRLKAYLLYKLQWDTSLDMDELIDDFFVHYFDEASDTMYELFMKERAWTTHIYADLGATGDVFEYLDVPEFWTYHQILEYMDMIEQAYADIETLRESNPERYAVLYDRILLESMQFRYLLIHLYYTEYSEAEVIKMKQQFRSDFERLGMYSYCQYDNINGLWKKWDIF